MLPDLPVTAVAPILRRALSQGHAVLGAEPGSGKTTVVPLLLLDEPWLGNRKIVMLEPRRPAARMAAHRMAALLGEPVGRTVGYQVRFERKVSAATRIEVLTEGLLLRRLQTDPELQDTGLLIFDEFHERSLSSDLSLALGLDVAEGLRDDLRLLVMSASLDAEPLAALLNAQRIEVAGKVYPVDIVWSDTDLERRDPVPACLGLLKRALSEDEGDVLVFLPGRREIDAMVEIARRQFGPELEILPLYGEMQTSEQDRVLRGRGAKRRVIVATDIAETSLTIDGVSAVVDSGLGRKPVFDPATGLTRLETRWISKASALQRTGRAGRQSPGRSYRGWTRNRELRFDDWTAPEIIGTDLTGLALELAAWGANSPSMLHWLDPPPVAHWQQAMAQLRQLHAVDGKGRITPLGRRMATLPVHPRLARILAAADSDQQAALAADIAALLSERDPLPRTAPGRSADIDLRLDALRSYRKAAGNAGRSAHRALHRIDRVAQQLRRQLRVKSTGDQIEFDAAACVALAYPDRVALCTSGDGRRYLMRNGRAAFLAETDPLRGSRCLAVAAVDAGRRDGVIWLAAVLDESLLEALFDDDIAVTREVRWDSQKGDAVARSVRRLDALVLEERAAVLQADDPVADILFEQIRGTGLAALHGALPGLCARIEIARRLDPQGGWPDASEPGLLSTLEQWLLPWLKPGGGMRELRRVDLEEALSAWLGWEKQQRLDAWLPTHFVTPAGSRRAIRYEYDGDPVLAAPLQEMLGLSESPRLFAGRLPLVLHLLSPAGRPLQVTADLAGFWRGAYGEVKKEMRGRYPKHVWPDDPASAQATRFSKRRARPDR